MLGDCRVFAAVELIGTFWNVARGAPWNVRPAAPRHGPPSEGCNGFTGANTVPTAPATHPTGPPTVAPPRAPTGPPTAKPPSPPSTVPTSPPTSHPPNALIVVSSGAPETAPSPRRSECLAQRMSGYLEPRRNRRWEARDRCPRRSRSARLAWVALPVAASAVAPASRPRSDRAA
jgi:hypothetical protein